LDEGSKGLDNFKAQAEAAGIVVSGPLAEAAEQFEQKFSVLKATLSQGFGNQLAAQLLPVLSTLADQLTSSTSAGEAFAEIAGVIVGGVKIIAAGVIEVISEFKQLGDSIGALGAVAVAVAHGDFSEASTIWKQSNADNVLTAKTAQDQMTAIFAAGTEKRTEIAKDGTTKPQAANLTALGESDAAVKELEKYNSGLKDQAAAFGLGGAALTNYKLQFGPLADAIKKAGDQGVTLAASIRANAAALQTKQDTKSVTDYTDKLQEQIDKLGQGSIAASDYATHTGTLGQALDRLGPAGETARAKIHDLAVEQTQLQNTDAFFHIDQQLQTMSGHLTQAAAAAFDFNNKLLIKNTAAAGTPQQQAQLDQLKQAEVLQAAYTEEVNKSTVAQLAYGTAEADVQLKQSQGQLTDLQAQAQLDVARKQEISDLTAIYEAQKKIADESGDPKLIQQAQATANSIKALQTQTDALAKSLNTDLVDDASKGFLAVETGAEGAKAAVADFFKDLEKQILSIADKDIAQSIFGTGGGGAGGLLAGLFSGGGGSGSGLSGLLSSIFGGTGSGQVISGVTQNGGLGGGIGNIVGSLDGFAGGGTIGAGDMAIVGEKGPELAYSGAKDLNIIPNGGLGGGKPISVTNNFTSQTVGGQISRPSQMQQAAAAARSLQQASRRNNT
jgi:hypothetical protein